MENLIAKYTPLKGEGKLYIGGVFFSAGEVIPEKHVASMSPEALKAHVDDGRITFEAPPAPTPPVPPAPVVTPEPKKGSGKAPTS